MYSEKFRKSYGRKLTGLSLAISAVMSQQAIADIESGLVISNNTLITTSLEINPLENVSASDSATDNTNPGVATSTATATGPVTSALSNQIENTGTINLTAEGSIGMLVEVNNLMTATSNSQVNINGNAGPYTGSASTTSVTDASASIIDNSILNSGSITSDTGIQLYTDAFANSAASSDSNVTANNDVSEHPGETASATSSATASSMSDAVILSNTVTNTGNINSLDTIISLTSNSFSETTTFADATATAIYDACGIGSCPQTASTSASESRANSTDSTSRISGNTVENSGEAFSYGRGIEIIASARAFDNSSETSTATAIISGNTINNTGTLISEFDGDSNGDGIKFMADADADLSTAQIIGNTISNSGIIMSMDDGIQIEIDDDTLNNAAINNNTFNVTYGGRIISDNGGIEIGINTTSASSASIDGNTFNISGLIVSDSNLDLTDGILTRGTISEFESDLNNNDFRARVIEISDASGATGSNTINIDPKSYFAGKFEFGSNLDTEVNLTSGAGHSTHWTFEDDASLGTDTFNTSGPVTWFELDGGSIDANNSINDEFATIDPSAFAAAPQLLADMSGMASDMAASSLRGDAINLNNGVWLSSYKANNNYSGDGLATMDQNTETKGTAIGYNHVFETENAISAGVMIGRSEQELSVGSLYSDIYSHSYDNESKGTFFGFNVAGNAPYVEYAFGINGGKTSHNDTRFINDNLAWWGISYAESKYHSTWLAPELNIAFPFAVNDTVTMKPSFQARQMTQKIDQIVETGSDANATIDARTVKVNEFRAGVDVIKSLDGATLTTSIGAMNRHLESDDLADVTMIGDSKEVPFYNEQLSTGYAGLYLNIGTPEDTVSFGFGGTFITDGEMEGGNIEAKFNLKF